MNEDRNQDREPKQQARQKHPDEWQRDLNPGHLAGQNIGPASDTATDARYTAFHLVRRNASSAFLGRKAGAELNRMDDEELKQVPLVPEGTRLQQGATYVDLRASRTQEFTARADMVAGPDNAYAPKDRVPYEIWNRLIGEPKPGQE